MINQYYPFSETQNYTRFFFDSKGQNGEITKGVVFSVDVYGFWNLGFGDLVDGELNDSVISNNHDVLMVIGTVAKIIYIFFAHYPDAEILIRPVDEKRKRLYNIVFQRHFDEISPIFEIIGIRDTIFEPYSVEQNYDFFIIKLR